VEIFVEILWKQVEETDNKIAVGNSFAIYSGNRCLLVAASSETEKAKWMEDLEMVIAAVGGSGVLQNGRGSSGSGPDSAGLYSSLNSNSEELSCCFSQVIFVNFFLFIHCYCMFGYENYFFE